MRVTPFMPVAWRRVLLVAEDARLRDGLGVRVGVVALLLNGVRQGRTQEHGQRLRQRIERLWCTTQGVKGL